MFVVYFFPVSSHISLLLVSLKFQSIPLIHQRFSTSSLLQILIHQRFPPSGVLLEVAAALPRRQSDILRRQPHVHAALRAGTGRTQLGQQRLRCRDIRKCFSDYVICVFVPCCFLKIYLLKFEVEPLNCYKKMQVIGRYY